MNFMASNTPQGAQPPEGTAAASVDAAAIAASRHSQFDGGSLPTTPASLPPGHFAAMQTAAAMTDQEWRRSFSALSSQVGSMGNQMASMMSLLQSLTNTRSVRLGDDASLDDANRHDGASAASAADTQPRPITANSPK